MRQVDWGAWIFCIAVGLLSGVIVAAVIAGVHDAGVRARCLEMGYPKYAAVWKPFEFTDYCIAYDGAVQPKVVRLESER
jgi:hypothetical protein